MAPSRGRWTGTTTAWRPATRSCRATPSWPSTKPAKARAPAATTRACASAARRSGWSAASSSVERTRSWRSRPTVAVGRIAAAVRFLRQADRLRPASEGVLLPGRQPQAHGLAAAFRLHQPHRHRHAGDDPGGRGLAVHRRDHFRGLLLAVIDGDRLGARAAERHWARLAVLDHAVAERLAGGNVTRERKLQQEPVDVPRSDRHRA